MDDETTDQRLEHHRNPPKFIELEDLFRKTGVEYFKVRTLCILQWENQNQLIQCHFQLDADNFKTDGKLDKIRKDRGYSYEDEVWIFSIS